MPFTPDEVLAAVAAQDGRTLPVEFILIALIEPVVKQLVNDGRLTESYDVRGVPVYSVTPRA